MKALEAEEEVVEGEDCSMGIVKKGNTGDG